MSKINSQGNRRRNLMKSIFIGGGLLGTSRVTMDRWLTPVIDSVILPAHALTSGPTTTRYSFVDPNFVIHPSPGAVGAEIGTASVTQNSASFASQLAEIVVPSAHAATAIQAPPITLELYLEKMAEDDYKFVLLLTATEGGLKLVIYGDGVIQAGDNTIHRALCDGNPKPLSVGLESVTEKSALLLIPGYEAFELVAAPGAAAPDRQSCSKT